MHFKDPITQVGSASVCSGLLDPNGKEVKRIGETEAALRRFKESLGLQHRPP